MNIKGSITASVTLIIIIYDFFFFFNLPRHFPIILSASGAYKFTEFACFGYTFINKSVIDLQHLDEVLLNDFLKTHSDCI